MYDFNFCRSRGCWDVYWRPIFENVPLIAGESGETDCQTDFICMYSHIARASYANYFTVDFMNYADTNNIHYFMWAWLPSDCATGPSLISDFDGTATNYGSGFKTHLDQLASNKVPTFSYTFNVYTGMHWREATQFW